MRCCWWVPTVAVLLVGACGGDVGVGADGGARQVPLTADDGGSMIELAAGDELIIDLEGNPATGYSWVNESAPTAVVAELGEPEFLTESDLIGAPGILRWRFEALAEGTTEIELAYRRPWEDDVEPERWFTVTVVVE